jgi:serine/threonine protein kinase
VTWICSHCGQKFNRYRTRCSADGQRVIEDLTGQTIGGRYTIRELIGVGGMDSTVWKAWQTGTERVVAVKVLPAADDSAARRFSRGARIAANLNHPNCTVVHDYGRSEDGKLFLVMEFLNGQVLQDLLTPDGMALADALHITVQVLQALEHAHGMRAVHRDLKPDNLFLSRRNEDHLHVKILDFGIAKYVEEDPEQVNGGEEKPPTDDFEDQVTEQRQVCGTPQYMAPEQVVGGRIDGRTDLYAVGCVLYRMLTGRLPFDGKTRYELYQKHLQESPRAFSDVRPDLKFPERLELIVMKALAKRPDQRFATAAEMRRALESLEVLGPRSAQSARPITRETSPSLPKSQGEVAATVLPDWTLSKPAVPPPTQRGGRPMREVPATLEAPPTILPPSLPVEPTKPPAATRNASRPKAPVTAEQRFAGDDTVPPVMDSGPVTTKPRPPEPKTARQERSDRDRAEVHKSPSLLNEAVVRHPPSRLTLSVVPEVPVSTETEPNRGQDAEQKPRHWKVLAILVGAFLLGVGGVAAAMRLLQQESTEVVPAQVDNVAEASRVEALSGQGVGLLDVASTEDPSDTATVEASEVEPLAEVVPEVTSEGETLAESLIYRFESEPSGATVSEGLEILGKTPLTHALPPGSHKITFDLYPHGPQTVEVIVSKGTAAEARVARVSFGVAPRPPDEAPKAVIPPATPKAVAPPPAPKPPTPVSPNAVVTPPATKPPAPKPTAPAATKPEVKLLEDDAPSAPKKPAVKLLDDDPAPPARPQIRTLDDE